MYNSAVRLFLLLVFLNAAVCFADTGRIVRMPNVDGERYEVRVPDTLDLADRARIAINGLTETLDREHNHEQYFLVRYTADPPFMMHFCIGDTGCTPKYAESLPMMRVMSGSDQNLNIEATFMSDLVDLLGEDGLYWVPRVDREKTPWRVRGNYPIAYEDMSSVFGDARMMLAMLAWYERDRDPAWKDRINAMVRGLNKIAIHRDDYAFYPEGKVGMEFAYLKESGWTYAEEPKSEHEGAEGTVMGYQGAQIRALCRWHIMTGNELALELAGKITNFVTQPQFWGTLDAQSKWIEGNEHGYFSGHFHGHNIAMRGILEYAHITNSQRLKMFVRDGYERARCWGIARLGIFGCGVWGAYNEGCSTADMVALAIKLSDYGVGDYWDDVDQFVRNNLVEQQLLDADLLKNVSRASIEHPEAYKDYPQEPMGTPWHPAMWKHHMDATAPQPLITDNVIDRSLGLFAGFSLPTTLPYPVVCGCCAGNCTQALYYSWESIVRFNDGVARVNLLLNRASPWLDVNSWLPYEGKVEILNKKAERMFVRIPRWVDKDLLEVKVNYDSRQTTFVGNYLFVGGLGANDVVIVRFPMVEETAQYTHQFDKTYTCHFKGNTLIDISPRDDNPTGYPIYLRDHYKETTAPMKSKVRYVSPVMSRW